MPPRTDGFIDVPVDEITNREVCLSVCLDPILKKSLRGHSAEAKEAKILIPKPKNRTNRSEDFEIPKVPAHHVPYQAHIPRPRINRVWASLLLATYLSYCVYRHQSEYRPPHETKKKIA
jgi:hypothetical protein